MSKKEQFIIDGEVFITKRGLIEHVRKILHSYKIDQVISPKHRSFLTDLIAKHHRWASEKIGAGIRSIRVTSNPVFKNKCFYIERVDGSESDFSFMECINKPKDWMKLDFLSACRSAIADQIISFRDMCIGPNEIGYCVLTGEEITRNNCHVDHIPPLTFEALVENWISNCNIDISKIEIGGYADGETRKYFMDGAIENSFSCWHSSRCNLRVISRKANLSNVKTNKEIMTPSHIQWGIFCEILEGENGCNFEEVNGVTRWDCNGQRDRPKASSILAAIPNIDVESSLKFFERHGGHCDCEILLNVEQ